MKYPAAILAPVIAIAFAIALAGCVLKGKPATTAAIPVTPKPAAVPAPPPAPPAPLSIPQTHADLPSPQPISSEALATTEAPGEPPPAPPPPPRSTKKGSSGTPAPRPKPAEAAPAPAPPPAPVVAEPNPPIQEIVPAEDANRLKASADAHKAEIQQRLDHVPRRLSNEQKTAIETIRSFVRLSNDAERAGDMRKANELAERGLVLAQGLPSAR